MLGAIFGTLLGIIVLCIAAGLGLLFLLAMFVKMVKRLFSDEKEYTAKVKFETNNVSKS